MPKWDGIYINLMELLDAKICILDIRSELYPLIKHDIKSEILTCIRELWRIKVFCMTQLKMIYCFDDN